MALTLARIARRPLGSLQTYMAVLAFLQAALLIGFAAQTSAQTAVEIDAQIAGDKDRTRFVAFLSEAADFRIFTLAEPYRVIVDLPETEIQVPGGPGRGLVFSARAGLFAEGKSRIVIDLTGPARVEKAQVLPAQGTLPARLVIDMAKTSQKAFAAASERMAHEMEAQPAAASARIAQQRDEKDKRPVIVIDPGHGGVDGGAVGASGAIEKEVTLQFAQALKKWLDGYGRYKVLLTRTIDVFVPLDERVEIAVGLKSDLFISIHADALDPKNSFGVKSVQEVRGATIYTLSEKASDAQAQAMAQRENKADIIAGLQKTSAPAFSEELESILNDLDNRIKKNRSVSFAKSLVEHMKGKMAFNVKPHRSADFVVLKASGVPSVLFELGYLSHKEDEKLLSSEEWRSSTTREVAASIDTFISERLARLPF